MSPKKKPTETTVQAKPKNVSPKPKKGGVREHIENQFAAITPAVTNKEADEKKRQQDPLLELLDNLEKIREMINKWVTDLAIEGVLGVSNRLSQIGRNIKETTDDLKKELDPQPEPGKKPTEIETVKTQPSSPADNFSKQELSPMPDSPSFSAKNSEDLFKELKELEELNPPQESPHVDTEEKLDTGPHHT